MNLYALPQTPAVLIDYEKTRENLLRFQRDAGGCAVRPHTKTHKMVEFAKLQVECGAKGICCAKVSEAEVMAAGGLDDIFLAYPLVGDFRIERAAALAKQIRLILTVDSEPGALALSAGAAKYGVTFEVRMEFDSQLKRTGIPAGDAVRLAKKISSLPGLSLTGISTYHSRILNGRPTEDNRAAGLEEGAVLAKMAERLRAEGLDIFDVSGGSTPTGKYVASVPGVTEVRPGTNIFNDYMIYREGACALEEISATLVMTVVSTPEPGYCVVDGGVKTFATDNPIPTEYGDLGYCFVKDNPDLVLNRRYEEHGIVVSRKGQTGLRVGQRIELYPTHICPTINLHNEVFVSQAGAIRRVRVDARGMLV